METPESIKTQYGSPRGETPEERRRRLVNRRAAKYRYFKSLDVVQSPRRESNNRRQRDRRKQLDEGAKDRIREQNRVRQQLRRQTLSDQMRQEIRERQRERQQMRRTRLDHDARETLRERERLRVRMRRAREARHDSVSVGQDPAERMSEWAFLLAPASPASLPASSPLMRHSRPAIDASDVLNSALHHQPIGAIQLPPVLGNSNNGNISHIVHARSEPELPELQPHLRQIQQQQQQQLAHLTFSGFQFSTLPLVSSAQITNSSSAFSNRIPQLPHLQMALPQAASLLNPSPAAPPPLLFQLTPQSSSSLTSASSGLRGIPGPPMSVGLPHASSIGMLSMAPPGSLMLHQPTQPQQMLPSIAIPPPTRALPPLPDFLNSRDSFGSNTVTSSSSSSFFSLMTSEHHANEYQDSGDTIFQG